MDNIIFLKVIFEKEDDEWCLRRQLHDGVRREEGLSLKSDPGNGFGLAYRASGIQHNVV